MKIGRIPGIIALSLALTGVWMIARHDSWFAPIPQEVPTQLIPGATVPGTLKTPLIYQFELKSNEFFSLLIQKLGTDVELTLFGPDGKEIRVVACSQDAPIRVSEIVSRSGQHTARLKNCDQDGPGRSFELTLSQPRAATKQDQLRVAAERASAEADLSAAQYQSGSRHTATEKYEDAIQKWIAAGDQVEEFRARTNLTKLYSESGSWEQASSASENALHRAVSIKEDSSEASALMSLAAIQLNRGDAKNALKTAQRALRISRSLQSRKQEAEANFLLGKVYVTMDSEDAPDALKDAQRIFQDLENRDGVARSMIYLAAIDANLNQYDIAIDAAQKSLAVLRSLNDRQYEGLALILLGNIRFRMGRPQEALTLYGQAESIVGDSGDLFAEGTLVGGIAEAHLNLGQKEAALTFFARALEKYQALRDQISIAWMLTALGRCNSEIGDTKAALGYLKLARDAFRKVPDKNGEAWVLNDIGLVYEAMGETKNALAHMRQALILDRSSAKPDPRLDAKALSGIARFYETKGNLSLTKAMENYKEALHLYETAQDRFGSLNTTYRIATILLREGRYKEALVFQEGAIREIEKVRASVANSDLRTSYFATARQQYDLYTDTLMHLHREIDAFEASEQSRARTLVDMIAETSLALSDGVDPRLIDSKATRIAELDKLSEQLQTLINANDNPKAIEKLNGEIINEKALLDDLDGRIRLQSPRYAAYVQPAKVTLAEVKNELGDSVMLEYAIGEDNSYLFAVTKQDFKSYSLPGKSEIESRVRAFRDLIMTVPSPLGGPKAIAEEKAKYEKAANELGAVLLGPAAGLLGDRRLVIVPDGILQALPFGALAIPPAAGSTFTPLALEHDIVNLASASALVASRRATPRRNRTDKTIAVFADAIYQPTDGRFSIRPNVSTLPGSAAAARVAATPARALQNSRSAPAAGSDADLPRLRYTQNEANAIFSLVSATDRLDATGWKATKAALQSPDLNRYKYIHIAAHSILNDAYPDLSSLVLSRWDSNGKPLDGSVRLRDVYNLKLSAELVVLSACDTGLGKEIRGEGLMSMVRAFMSIGTPRVLATLWKVDDEQTSAFMTEFYKQLLDRHLSPAAAIREAQKTLLQKAGTQSPYYWAGFQLHGDWR